MSIACEPLIQSDVALAGRTWFRLGGSAQNFCAPNDVAELRNALHWARSKNVPVRVLGGGANLLVRDGSLGGLVISLSQPAFCGVSFDGDRVKVGAGVDLMHLSRDCSYDGLAGLECLAGIPGTVGGAIAMNAGGRFGSIGDSVERVRLIDRAGVIVDRDVSQMCFAYRQSALEDRIVLEAVLKLRQEPVDEVKRRYQDNWRFKKDSQPLAAHSAGCIFKNPEGDVAGRLIDRAGLKGFSRGRARVSEIHGNFIVADEGATASDVLEVLEYVRETVLKKTGVRLETEIDVW
ncbi:MAG: UDP-N-acetylmuramate dehydrogenase [Planctomycetes bacterium]|nr:UDP-N-acetylmuramate dehydrogenase [Planctomycetota bacterium]